MEEKEDRRTQDKVKDKELADNLIQKNRQELQREEEKHQEYLGKLKENFKVVETQVKTKEEWRPKVMNETEEKINKDLLHNLKNRNLLD